MNEEQRYLFDLQGYLVLPGVLTPDEVSQLNAIYEQQAIPPPDLSIESQRFSGFFLWDEAYRRLMDHRRVVPLLKSILGPDLRLDHAYGIKMRTGTDGLTLHGGNTPYDPPEYYHVRGGQIYCGLTVVTFALCDVPSGQGGFCCVPGSHKANFPLPPGVKTYERDLGCLTQVPMKTGDVLIFTEALTHGTLRWSAPWERRSILLKYSPGFLAWGRANWPSTLLELATPTQRQLLEGPYVNKRPEVGAVSEK